MAEQDNHDEQSYVFSGEDDISDEPHDTSEKDTTSSETTSVSPSPPESPDAEPVPSHPDASTGAIPKRGNDDELASSLSAGPSSRPYSDSRLPDISPMEAIYRDTVERLAGSHLTEETKAILLRLCPRVMQRMGHVESVQEQIATFRRLVKEEAVPEYEEALRKLFDRWNQEESSADGREEGTSAKPPADPSGGDEERETKEVMKEDQPPDSSFQRDYIPPMRERVRLPESLPTLLGGKVILGSFADSNESATDSDATVVTESGVTDSESTQSSSETESHYPSTLESSSDAETLQCLSLSSSDEAASETGDGSTATEPANSLITNNGTIAPDPAVKQDKRPAESSGSDEERRVSPRKKLTLEKDQATGAAEASAPEFSTSQLDAREETIPKLSGNEESESKDGAIKSDKEHSEE